MRNAKLFAGTSHLALAQRVAGHLGVELAPVSLRRYTNRETTVDLGCSVREKDVYILQSGSMTTNDHLMEALIMVSAAKLASARKITVVMPYFPYSKQSKKKKRRGAISGKLVASMLGVAGADHVITMDLHASQMSGFFTIPVDNLVSEPTIARWVADNVIRGRGAGAGSANGVVVVAKNAGGAKRVTALADRLGSPFALIHTDNAPSTRPFSRTPSTVALHTLTPTSRGPNMFASAASCIPIGSPPAARAMSPHHEDQDLRTIPDAAPSSGSGGSGRPASGRRIKGKRPDVVEALAASAQRAAFYVSPLMAADEQHAPEPDALDIGGAAGGSSPPPGMEISEVLNRSDDDDDDDIDHGALLEMVNTPADDDADADADAEHNCEAIEQAAEGILEQRLSMRPAAVPVADASTPASVGGRQRNHLQPQPIQRITSGTHLQSDPPLRPPVAVTSWHKKRTARITLVGDVRDKIVLLLDDMIDHPSSFLTAAEHLMVHCQARAVYIVAAHGLFSGSSLGEVEICPYVQNVIVTNTFPIPDELTSASSKLIQIDIAPVLAEAIRRNHNGESISYLFDLPKDMKESLVRGVFSSVASSYDVMNDAMSMGVHRLWKDHFIRKMAPQPGAKLLDVAGGTGDITQRFLEYQDRVNGDSTSSVHMLDINPEMLAEGERRFADSAWVQDGRISFAVGNAERLEGFADETFDAYSIAFGIRNCTRPEQVVREAYRVLKPGGRFMCLEFSRVENPVLAAIYDFHSFNVIPRLGEAIAGDRASYEYLVESIRRFPPQNEFAQIIRDAGFTTIGKGYENLTFGTVAIHTGYKF
ncbi:2-hexaprenyl-6-methoxy-1,4-benzoquinone methyltransferase [Coemansia sp. BCRC 34962]|nr:2-hexaprenyl-6-methoxy-1,4-benzoquinone methyltransferase [Coemansia sp. BCRC 34962]